MLRLFAVFLLLLSAAAGLARMSNENEDLVDSLNTVVGNIDAYIGLREHKLNNLKEKRNAAVGMERAVLAEDIAREYVLSDLDSAYIYYMKAYDEAHNLGNHIDAQRIDMIMTSIMPIMGVVKEGLERFERIDPNELPYDLKKYYWRCAAELYHGALRYYNNTRFSDEYRTKTLVAIDSLATYYPQDSEFQKYFTAYMRMLSGETGIAVATFLEAMPHLGGHPEMQDFAMSVVKDYYVDRPSYKDVYDGLVLRRALNSLRRGLIRGKVLNDVGMLVFENGNEELGRRCVSMSMDIPDRSYAGYSTTFGQEAYADLLLRDSRALQRARMVFIVALVLTIAITIFLIARANERTRNVAKKLKVCEEEIKQVRAEYKITTKSLINLAFEAIEDVKEYNLHVARKLKTGQVKDLLAEVDSGSFVAKQNEHFFELFDANFLSDFPFFLTNLNSLLLPDRQLELLPGNRLSPELRIAAFMRLGVTDSNRLAQALGLSLNTIYTYRNRLKGRAKNRETFEQDVAMLPGAS